MVLAVLCVANGVDVMGYTLGVRKTEEEVEVRLRRAVVKLSGTSLAELCSRDRRSTKTPVLLRQAGTTEAMEMSRR
jgi:hypothetical protein